MQWLKTVVVLLVTMNFYDCAAITDPPVIELVGGVRNASVVTFYNGTLLVLSKDVVGIMLNCNASYPVMWALDSLEQPWTISTASHRDVTDFRNKSTYKYSMSVRLENIEVLYTTLGRQMNQVSLKPEEYVCRAAAAAGSDAANGLVSKMVIVWEANNNMTNSSQHWRKSEVVYWGPDRSDTDEILIPCFTVNVNDSAVELYRKSSTRRTRTRTFLASEVPGRPFNSTTGSGIRFEKYVGFFIKPSLVTEDDELYECRVKKWNGNGKSTDASHVKAEVTTRATQKLAVRVTSTQAPSNRSFVNASSSDENDDDHPPDYTYISSEDELFGPNNVTNTTSTDDGDDAEQDDDEDDFPNSYRMMILLIRRNSSADGSLRKAERKPDTLSTYLNRKNPRLNLERTDNQSVTCCVNHEDGNGSYMAENMVLYHKWCHFPLLCLTKSHLLKSTYIYNWARDDFEVSSRCRYINTTDEDRTSFNIKPVLYICHMRTDRRFTRSQYLGTYHLSRHLEMSENSYLLETTKDGSTYTDQEYYEVNRGSSGAYVNDFSNATFYEGQTAKFRCAEAAFFYATGKVWELHWKNGTSKFVHPQDRKKGDLANVLELNITRALVGISCHFPPWNSTEWFTRSGAIKVEETTLPSSVNGETNLSETVEFFVGESRKLRCALDGHPPPKYEWTAMSSSAYTLLEKSPRYYYGYEYHDTPSYAGQSPSSYSAEPKVQNVTVSVSSYYIPGKDPVPVGGVKCVATNVAGKGFIQFRLQAKRPELPVLGFEGRGLNRVFFVHDTARLLNCTLRKGLPQAAIYWQRHDMNISNSEHYEIQVSGNSSALLFKSSIDYEDEGDYTCIASNLAGNARLQFRVQIREPSPHSSSPWYAFGLILLALLIIVVIAAFAFVCIRKSRKITRLEMRAEYTKAYGDHEDEASRLTTGF